jgi:hypothetical protein
MIAFNPCAAKAPMATANKPEIVAIRKKRRLIFIILILNHVTNIKLAVINTYSQTPALNLNYQHKIVEKIVFCV